MPAIPRISRQENSPRVRSAALALATAIAVCLGLSPAHPADSDSQHAEAAARIPPIFISTFLLPAAALSSNTASS